MFTGVHCSGYRFFEPAVSGWRLGLERLRGSGKIGQIGHGLGGLCDTLAGVIVAADDGGRAQVRFLHADRPCR